MRLGLATFAMAVLPCLAAGCSEGNGNGGDRASDGGPRVERPAAPQYGVPPLDALAELEAAVAADPNDPEAHRRLARAFFAADRYEQSRFHFERAAELAPGDPGPRLELALTLTAIGRVDEADALLATLSDDPVVGATALYNRGNIARRKGDLQSAAALYRSAIAQDSGYVRAYHGLGMVLQQAERFREAYQTFSRILDLDVPDDPAAATDYVDALYRMALLDLRMGATERAAEYLVEVLAVLPDHPRAHYDYGVALERLGREDEAREAMARHEALQAQAEP